MKCKNKICKDQGNYERGCIRYLDKDSCQFHSENPNEANAEYVKLNDAITAQLSLYKKALGRTLEFLDAVECDIISCEFQFPCGSPECIQLHLDNVKEEEV